MSTHFLSYPCFIRVSSVAAILLCLGCNNGGNPPAVKIEAPATVPTQSGTEMLLTPAGSFEMGSKRGRDDEKPVHTVWIDSFLMDKHEMTQAVWEKIGK